jgi:hypothetical protein
MLKKQLAIPPAPVAAAKKPNTAAAAYKQTASTASDCRQSAVRRLVSL